MRRSLALTVARSLSVVGVGLAQVTGMPSYDAPYRAFSQHEAGAILSFPDIGGTAIEGEYRFGYQKFDVGMRGGVWDPGGVASSVVLLGIAGRQLVVTHAGQFPLGGAVVVGFGAHLVSGGNGSVIPGGLSLGRLIELKNSPVTITPYAEPVLFLWSAPGLGTDLRFAFGVGGDFRLSRMFDLRVSGGLGDDPMQGISIGAVWVH